MKPHAAEMLLVEPPVGSPQEACDLPDLLSGGPDISGIAAATVPTLRAFKLEPGVIPFPVFHFGMNPNGFLFLKAPRRYDQ